MAVTEAMPIPDLGPLDSMDSLVRNIVAGQLRKVGCEELAPNGPYG